MISLAISIQLASYSDEPILFEVALRNVFAIAPPIIILSTFLIKLSRSWIFVETFDPPMIATTGFVGWENTSSSAKISFSMQSPKKLGRNLGSPLRDACFLCEAANASFTYTCPILLSSSANLLSFSSSCGKNLIFSNKNISSSCLVMSSSSLLINLTFLFIFFSNSLAIGSIDREISI